MDMFSLCFPVESNTILMLAFVYRLLSTVVMTIILERPIQYTVHTRVSKGSNQSGLKQLVYVTFALRACVLVGSEEHCLGR